MLYKTRTTSGNRATPREPRQSAAGTGGRSGDSKHDSDNGGPEAPASNTIGTGWPPQTGHCPSLGSLVVLRARGGRPIPRARKSQWTKRGNQENWRETGNRAAMGTTQGVETQWWLRTSVSTTAQPTGGGQPRPLLLGCFLSHARANVKFSTPGPRNPRNQRAHTRAPANTVARGVAQGKQPVGATR